MKENKKEKKRVETKIIDRGMIFYFKNILLSIRYTVSELAKIIQSSMDLLKSSTKNFVYF